MASDNVTSQEPGNNQESGNNKDAGNTKDPVFPIGIDDPLAYEAFHPAGPGDANKPPSSFRVAGQVIEDAVQGAVNTVIDEAKNHKGKFALEAGGAVGLTIAATAASPIIAGVAGIVGAGEAIVAGAATVGTAVEGLAGATLGLGTIRGGVAAFNDTKDGLNKSEKDIEIITHPEKHTPQEIAQANKNIKANVGPGALEAILTAGGAAVAGGNVARLLGKVSIAGKAAEEISHVEPHIDAPHTSALPSGEVNTADQPAVPLRVNESKTTPGQYELPFVPPLPELKPAPITAPASVQLEFPYEIAAKSAEKLAAFKNGLRSYNEDARKVISEAGDFKEAIEMLAAAYRRDDLRFLPSLYQDDLTGEMINPDALALFSRDTPNLPTQVYNLVKDQPLWKQAAAEIAWRKTAPEASSPSAAQLAQFTEQWQYLCARGSSYVRTQTDDPSLQFMTFPAKEKDAADWQNGLRIALESATSTGHRNSATDLFVPHPELTARILGNLQLGPYLQALERVGKTDGGDLHKYYTVGSSETALRLAGTFSGRSWREWLYKQNEIGRDTHDATYWLPVAPVDKLKGLSNLLLSHYKEPIEDLATIAERWPYLDETARSKNYTTRAAYDELLHFIHTSYANVQHEGLAQQAIQAGIRSSEYPSIENRFLRSLDVESELPIGQTWSSGDLVGRFLPRNDPRGIFMGEHTDCCLRHNHATGRQAAWYGQEQPNSGFFVVEDAQNNIVGGSWVTVSDNGGLLFNNVEAKDFRELGADNKTRVGEYKIGPYQQDVANIYQAAANDLSARYHTVAVGRSHSDLDLSVWQPAAMYPPVSADNGVPLPSDYSGHSEAAWQLILAVNPDLLP